jgi:hypothetical protein
LIIASLLIIAFSALVTFFGLIWVALSPTATTQALIADLAAATHMTDVASVAGNYLRITLQVIVGVVAMVAIYFFLQGKDQRGVIFALIAIVMALTAVQLVTFYLDQFTAILPTLFQFALLFLVLSYQRWHLDQNPQTDKTIVRNP